MPLLCALRDQFPYAHLAWVVEGRAGDLLEGHPALSQLIRVPRRWLRSPRDVWRLRQQLRAARFDIAIDVQGLTKSAIAAWLSGAAWRIGNGGRDGRELSPWLNTDLARTSAEHVVARSLELLRPLGIEQPRARFDVPVHEPSRRRMESFLARQQLDAFAMINPGAGWPSKIWPPDRFAQVARHLQSVHRLPVVVVWAGDEERHLAESIVAGAREGSHLAPPTSLTELAALARRSCLFVASDTGPLHLAAAVETPCVGLYGPMPHECNGPFGSQHIALQNERLTGGSRQRRTASDASMRAITADEVCAACDAILSRQLRVAS